MLTYNMAMTSDDRQESTGTISAIWAWLNASNNSGAVQAIGSIMQAIAAFFTLLAMIYLGIMQNSMSKHQLEASFFDKRYRFSMRILDKVNESIIVEPSYHLLKSKGYSHVSATYIYRVSDIDDYLKQAREKLSFYFCGDVLDRLKELLKEAVDNSNKMNELRIKMIDAVDTRNNSSQNIEANLIEVKKIAECTRDKIIKVIQRKFSLDNFM